MYRNRDNKNNIINTIVFVIKYNLYKIAKLLIAILALNYTYKHEESNKHILNAFAEIKLAMACV